MADLKNRHLDTMIFIHNLKNGEKFEDGDLKADPVPAIFAQKGEIKTGLVHLTPLGIPLMNPPKILKTKNMMQQFVLLPPGSFVLPRVYPQGVAFSRGSDKNGQKCAILGCLAQIPWVYRAKIV